MKKIIVACITVLIIFGVSIYWFSYRPSQIRKECADKTTKAVLNKSIVTTEAMNTGYNFCLNSRGLSK